MKKSVKHLDLTKPGSYFKVTKNDDGTTVIAAREGPTGPIHMFHLDKEQTESVEQQAREQYGE